jgi:hypothetical protein
MRRIHIISKLTRSNDHQVMDKPEFCRENSTPSKPSCDQCNAPTLMTMASILLPNKGRQQKILKEFKLHNHPSSRSTTVNGAKIQRTTEQAAQELADHYSYQHGYTNQLEESSNDSDEDDDDDEITDSDEEEDEED